MRRIALCLAALALVATGAACGGDKGPPLTADEFARQSNAICKANDAKLADEGKQILKDANTSPQQLVKFYLDNAIPNARRKLKAIGNLNPPAKEKDKVKKMLSDGKKATDAVEQGLKKQGAAYLTTKGESPFKQFDSDAKDLNLTDCAGKS
jgi:hypothetical protein